TRTGWLTTGLGTLGTRAVSRYFGTREGESSSFPAPPTRTATTRACNISPLDDGRHDGGVLGGHAGRDSSAVGALRLPRAGAAHRPRDRRGTGRAAGHVPG